MYLLFDIGGTKTRLATSDGQAISDSKIFDTSQNFEEGIKNITEAAKELVGDQKIEAAAGGIREVLDTAHTMLINNTEVSRIPDWIRKPLKEKLEQSLGTKVFLENDAALATLGEAIHGAGQGKNIVVYLTISTGVGGARVVNGRIDAKASAFEPGDLIINSQNELVYLTDLVSGPSIKRIYNQEPEELEDAGAWEEVAKNLSIGLNNVIVLWSPDIIILGGGVMNKVSIEQVENHLKELLRKYPEHPQIVKATLDDESGLYGALECLKQNHAK